MKRAAGGGGSRGGNGIKSFKAVCGGVCPEDFPSFPRLEISAFSGFDTEFRFSRSQLGKSLFCGSSAKPNLPFRRHCRGLASRCCLIQPCHHCHGLFESCSQPPSRCSSLLFSGTVLHIIASRSKPVLRIADGRGCSSFTSMSVPDQATHLPMQRRAALPTQATNFDRVLFI